MKRILIVAILVLGLLLVPTAAQAAGVTVVDKTGDGVWDGNTWQIEILPGETKSTTLTLYNSSSSSLDVEVSVTLDSLDDGNLTFELDKSDFTISKKSYTNVILTIEAGGSATPGTYTTELTIKSEVPPSDGGGGGGDISSLRLYSLTVENITEDSADIIWKTSRTATTKLTYWSSPEVIIRDRDYVKEHLIHLEDLKDDTTYYFKITCEDRYDLRKSDRGEFTTLEKEVVEPEPEPTPPEPTEPVVPEPAEPIEPIEPVEPIAPEPEQETPWGLIVGIVVGLVLVAGGIVYWRKRQIT